MGHIIEHCTDLEDIGRKAAAHIYEIYKKTLEHKERFTLVLSGGNTPEVLHRTLASSPFDSRFDWNRVQVFWGDERYVPKEDPESNYGMAYRSLLSGVPIPEENVYPMPTDACSVDGAAEAYENTLREIFSHTGSTSGSPAMPIFDLVLLGLGADGHTASLFPGKSTNPYESRWVISVNIPPTYPTRERITLTLPVLNAAANIVFLVSGSSKGETLKRILKKGPVDDESLPPEHLNPASDIFWFTDIDVVDF